MIYLKLLYNFFLIGLFSIGGGYTAITFASDMARDFHVIDEDMISNFVAISESTPGPFAVNFATFVGTETGGILGAIVATVALVLPAFFIILLFIIFLKDILKNKKFTYGLSIIRACVIGIIMAVGLSLFCKNIYAETFRFDSFIIFLLILAFIYLYKKFKEKAPSSIIIIIVGAVLGIIVNIFI